MAKQSEDLIDEAHGNLNEDRNSIKEFTSLLNKAISTEGEIDPLAKIALAESFARLTGELSKNNSLLIELAKIRAKKEMFSNRDKGFNEEEKDSMFDEIEDEEGEEEGSN